ncbi:MAG: putative endonuclease [Bermanella sp.]|jgi:putative endonuclease
MLKTNKEVKSTRVDGQFFEDKACAFLQQKGLTLSERNVNFPTGEIDLIMLDGPQLVFVEVRFRHNNEFGGAAASIDNRKQKKLIKTAQLYLQKKFGSRPPSCRFDVIAINGDKKKFNVNWIKNAI